MAMQKGFGIPAKLSETTDHTLFGVNYMISEKFGIDGRNEDEYGHIFEWEELTDPIWTEGPYSIRGCVEFEPDCVVLIHDGDTVGFYMGGQAWVDEIHRGHDFGAKMIVSCIAMSGRLPEVKNVGFSEAGFAAHKNALELMRNVVPIAGKRR